MKLFIKRLLVPAVIGSIALVLLSAMVWWLLPLFTAGGEHVFDSSLGRVAIIVSLWLGWLLYLGMNAWRRRHTNARLLRGIAAGPSASDRESQLLAERFNEAIGKLRQSSQRSLWRPNSYIYELPWYVFVGAPGSGKTTALQNAGLQFLLTGGKDGAAVRGVGGTRNCDWWFTREAVLIDTAGRYTIQESDQAADATAWNTFLALLRKTRPRQPVNGVLLTVNVQDLLQQGPDERADHAAKLRARLREIEAQLDVRAPIYVLVTKADLIAGFHETFGELGKEERDQVWGFTFAPTPIQTADPLPGFDAEFRDLEVRLGQGLPDLMERDRDVMRRSAQFGFMQEFAALRAPLRDFLAQVFSAGSASHTAPLVRGVYFTSGTQEGTPIDRVMGALSRSFGLARAGGPAASGKGKSFFLNALLHKVIFPERDLVSRNAAAERRRHTLRWSAIAAMGIAASLVLMSWIVSYGRNATYASEVLARVPELRQKIEALPAAPAGEVVLLAQPLAGVRDAALPAGSAVDEPGLLNTLGLYQGQKLDAGARLAYHRLLDQAMLPRVTRRLEERLRAASRDNLEAAYLGLKTYMMLYTPDRFDNPTLKTWIALDWDAQFGATLAPEQRAALDQHLDALLADGAPRAGAPMDKALIASVREMLTGFALEQRIYSQLKRQLDAAGMPEFSVARAAGTNAATVFIRASREPLTRGIPGLYTRDGYQRAFQPALPKAASQLASEEIWVLGLPDTTARSALAATNTGLLDRVRRLYLQDYTKRWEAYLNDVKVVRSDDMARNVEVARLLAAVDSPLASFQREVAAETTLVPPAPKGKIEAGVSAAADKANAAREEMARLAGNQPAANVLGLAGQPIERIVDDRFTAYRRLFQGQPAPIEEQQKLFNEVFVQLAAIDAAQKSKSAPPTPDGGERLKASASQQPDVVRAIVETLVDSGTKRGRAIESENLTSELKPITDFCLRSIANRYPFAAGARADVLPDDFGQLFGVGGMLDDFYQRRLSSLVDTGKPSWAYKPLADGSAPASPSALAEFQRAARIKEAFFRNGGKTPGFKLDIKLLELSDGLKELTLDIDGQSLKFAAGTGSIATIGWPGQRVASELRLTTLPATNPVIFEGPWALFRLFDRFETQASNLPEKFVVVLNLDGKQARLEVTANSVLNPFRLREVRQFRCPGAL